MRIQATSKLLNVDLSDVNVEFYYSDYNNSNSYGESYYIGDHTWKNVSFSDTTSMPKACTKNLTIHRKYIIYSVMIAKVVGQQAESSLTITLIPQLRENLIQRVSTALIMRDKEMMSLMALKPIFRPFSLF